MIHQRTPLYANHLAAQAKIVDFGGWDMPLHYGSQVREHHLVRSDAGLFDVSHMTIIEVTGEQAYAYLRYLLANDVAKLRVSGKALYSCMLNPAGGVIDDLIVYYFSPTDYRIVVNAATCDKDWAWLQQQSEGFRIELRKRTDLAMLALQGPKAIEKTIPLLAADRQDAVRQLKPFYAQRQGEWMIARTGYTGEDGLEIMLPAAQAPAFWDACLANKIAPIGLGARDTLRLEAGMALYGHEMDEQISPDAAGLTWTVAWDEAQTRQFIGREALAASRDREPALHQVGLVLEGKGVLRQGYRVLQRGLPVGEITSGTFSPTLEQAIALVRIASTVTPGQTVEVEVRNKLLPARVVQPPFVRKGNVLV